MVAIAMIGLPWIAESQELICEEEMMEMAMLASLQQSRVQSPPSETSCRFGSPGKEQQARLIFTES